MPVTPLSFVTRAIFAMALSLAAAHRVHHDHAYDYEPVGAEETRAEESVGSAVAESRSFPFGEDGFGVSETDYVDAESPSSNDPVYAPTLGPTRAPPLPATPPTPTETETTSNDTETKSNDTLAPTLAPPLPPPPPTPEEEEQAPPLPPPPPAPEEEETRRERERIASLPIVQSYDKATMLSMDDPEYQPGDWLLGRATYFDAPDSWKETFAPHLFGDLYGNGCGFLNKSPERRNVNKNNDDFPFPLDAVAAVTDFDLRLIEGACGSCFEIGCVTGPVLHSFDQNDKIEGFWAQKGFYEQAPGALDSYGRRVPSRNAQMYFREVDDDDDDTKKVNHSYLAEYARCWNESTTIFVKIVDKCPCSYFYEQTICCGPMPHFDLSYWGYEKLLHPIQGKAMIRFRPVNCDTRVPVDTRLGAAGRMDAVALEGMEGVLTRADSSGQRVAQWGGRATGELSDEEKKRKVTVFANGPSPGWLINSYGDWYVSLFAAGMGMVVVDSSVSSVKNDTNATTTTNSTNNATCAVLQPGGRLLVRCEQCEKSLKPFGGNDGRVVSFFVRIAPYIEQLPVPPGTNSTVTWWEPSLDMTECIDSTVTDSQIWRGDSPILYLGISTTGAFDFALEKAPDEVPCGKKTVVKHEGPCGVRVVVSLADARCVGRAAERANSVFLELGHANDNEHVVCVDDMFVESTK